MIKTGLGAEGTNLRKKLKIGFDCSGQQCLDQRGSEHQDLSPARTTKARAPGKPAPNIWGRGGGAPGPGTVMSSFPKISWEELQVHSMVCKCDKGRVVLLGHLQGL